MASHSLLPIFLLFAVVPQVVPQVVPDQIPPQPIGKLIDIGGYSVHLYCTGTGSPTVIIVGGGFSFDWGLVQPKIAEFTRVCTYDASGTAWSDPFPAVTKSNTGIAPAFPAPLCVERVDEIHKLLKSAAIDGPYVLVGFSIGGLFARLYAAKYPEHVAGMVIVDHAFIDPIGKGPPSDLTPVRSKSKSADSEGPLSIAQLDTAPILISDSGMAFGIEDDRNFKKLPQLNQDLHLWAMSANPVRPTAEAAAECMAAVETATGDHPYPVGDMPLIVVSTGNDDLNYGKLQTKLLLLSRDAKQVIAANSSHMVIVDRPEVIVSAARRVVGAVRAHESLK